MKLQENKKPTELNLGQQTWTQIQDVATGEKKANGKSTLALMTLGVKSMEEIKIIVKGSDERAAMEALIALIESQFKV